MSVSEIEKAAYAMFCDDQDRGVVEGPGWADFKERYTRLAEVGLSAAVENLYAAAAQLAGALERKRREPFAIDGSLADRVRGLTHFSHHYPEGDLPREAAERIEGDMTYLGMDDAIIEIAGEVDKLERKVSDGTA